ncbi:FecR family protein [Catalinimonas sp. 4WD22]|uniref:FecR family protein n=1 Tax=Catalinimonas locisalis TaxID=3133978 RepID=UPI003101B0FB
MNQYEDYTVEDFFQDELFIQWCYNSSPELTEYWQAWCLRYPDKVSAFQKAREIIQSIEYRQSETASEEVYQRILQGVLQESDSKITKSDKGFFWNNSWKVAAAIMMMVAAAVFYLGKQEVSVGENVSSTSTRYIEKYCPPGKKMNVVLKDGTKVKLNGDTYLSYAENFGDSTREVALKGEAFFEVTKDSLRPFMIRSQYLQTTVLGTSFNIQAYPDSRKVDVSVLEGLVRVCSDDEQYNGAESTEFYLRQSEKLSFTPAAKEWEKEIVPISSIGRWRNWELIFEQDDIFEIAHKLERWYGIEVVLQGPFKRKISFSGIYNNNTLHAVLEGITYSANLHYTLQGDTVFIKP